MIAFLDSFRDTLEGLKGEFAAMQKYGPVPGVLLALSARSSCAITLMAGIEGPSDQFSRWQTQGTMAALDPERSWARHRVATHHLPLH